MINSWFKNAIIYSLDVKTFKDSDNDGMGDFQGLISKLDYLASLGVTCLWLTPFYPSPKIDNGYDVTDYYNIDAPLGNLGDFVQFIHEADQRGIKVIIDLVVNHASIRNSWFQDAKKNRDSKYRNYFIWDDQPKENKEKIMFEGMVDSIWEYTKETDSYYLHKYFKEQADFNIANPDLRSEVIKIMEFWLKLGVSGFRIDAAHVVTDPTDVDHINFDNLHRFFGDMRDFLKERNPQAILLGEASLPPDDHTQYFISEEGKPRMHMLFNFISNKHAFLAFAREEGSSLTKGLKLCKKVKRAHWVNFVRNHDELNLELLDEEEKKEVWEAFAPEKEMRLFGHGVRRRLPPMLKNDLTRLKSFYAIMFALPGTPLLIYGEEIGMGDDLSLGERNSVRTVMQWSDEENGGFSYCDKDRLFRPAIDHGDYSYHQLNVRDQQKKPDSFLNWLCSLIRTRKQNPVIGAGSWHILKPLNDKTAAWYFQDGKSPLMIVCNLSGEEVYTKIVADFIPQTMKDIFADSEYEDPKDLNNLLLNPYGFRWIQILNKKDINLLNN
jgi:maltose alpha-D-glucosyltransferase / alpha-amylase